MVTDRERRFIVFMVNIKMWRVGISMRLHFIYPMIGNRTWLLDRLHKRQIVDSLHHAPCCPANHYHKARLVFQPCTCGAALEAVKGK